MEGLTANFTHFIDPRSTTGQINETVIYNFFKNNLQPFDTSIFINLYFPVLEITGLMQCSFF